MTTKGSKLKKRVNKVATTYIEQQMGYCAARKDWGGYAALKRLAKDIGAPIEDKQVTFHEKAALDVKAINKVHDFGYVECNNCDGTGKVEDQYCKQCFGDGQVKDGA